MLRLAVRMMMRVMSPKRCISDAEVGIEGDDEDDEDLGLDVAPPARANNARGSQ